MTVTYLHKTGKEGKNTKYNKVIAERNRYA